MGQKNIRFYRDKWTIKNNSKLKINPFWTGKIIVFMDWIYSKINELYNFHNSTLNLQHLKGWGDGKKISLPESSADDRLIFRPKSQNSNFGLKSTGYAFVHCQIFLTRPYGGVRTKEKHKNSWNFWPILNQKLQHPIFGNICRRIQRNCNCYAYTSPSYM